MTERADSIPTTAELFSVAGRTALVTGGTRGIGLMIARALVGAGARVVVSSRKPEACAQAAQELSRAGDCVGIPADVGSAAAAADLADATVEHFGGRLDILVNNAGVTWGAPLDDFPEHGWDKVMDTNAKGAFLLTVALLDALRAAGTAQAPARVVNIGSVAGTSVPPDGLENYSYSASKAAVHMLSRHLARRLSREHVTVNAIAPGHFVSRMSAFLMDDPAARAEIEESVPVGRIGSPADIAGATLFLVSPAGAYVTGAILPVDGGLAGCA